MQPDKQEQQEAVGRTRLALLAAWRGVSGLHLDELDRVFGKRGGRLCKFGKSWSIGSLPPAL